MTSDTMTNQWGFSLPACPSGVHEFRGKEAEFIWCNKSKLAGKCDRCGGLGQREKREWDCQTCRLRRSDGWRVR